jgi:hypothetical protein
MKKILLLTFFIAFNFYAQSNNYLIITKINVGAAFPGGSSYIFTDNPSRNLNERLFPVNPNFSFGIGLESPKIFNFYEANLSLAIDLLYGKASTGDVETFYGTSKYTVTGLPILLWTKIATNGKIVPYVKVGIGAERTELIEKYNLKNESDFNLKEWFFSWGIGAGLEVNTFNNFTLSLFVDAIIIEGGIAKKLSNYREINYDYRNGMIFSGIQFGYKL